MHQRDTTEPARILVINPNSSQAVTAAIDAALDPLRLAGGPAIAVTDLPDGPASIASQQDADSVVMPLARRIAADGADAFVIACFSDPGLHTAREVARGRPVMGIAEWGILRSLTLGERFGIVALSEGSVRRQRRMVRQMGLGERYAGSRPVEARADETAGEAIRDRLIAAARMLIARDGADVIVLGCAGMAPHRRAIEDAVGCAVVEPCQQAVAAALGAVLLETASLGRTRRCTTTS
ncbi:aspartate/glutamate racemase family protein [Methylobacterium sp. E-066]|uniref:aspartate/glutamate racemase family protein n=2 Tax=unclassified Methylobacterium TaxID=2615210 RepID=UPI001FB987DB|nr:aspartate/glutamate racemase family protein [Methylobacterium sp. E-066]MCJ2144337.1 aspartate/glutamate racemase family protein [Methylobacterium sp. E-066]